jgi:hypothetical protein
MFVSRTWQQVAAEPGWLGGAKDDPTDAEFALKLLLSHAAHFKPLQRLSLLENQDTVRRNPVS